MVPPENRATGQEERNAGHDRQNATGHSDGEQGIALRASAGSRDLHGLAAGVFRPACHRNLSVRKTRTRANSFPVRTDTVEAETPGGRRSSNAHGLDHLSGGMDCAGDVDGAGNRPGDRQHHLYQHPGRGELPEKQRPRARTVGLALAMGTRILLLLSITWVMR